MRNLKIELGLSVCDDPKVGDARALYLGSDRRGVGQPPGREESYSSSGPDQFADPIPYGIPAYPSRVVKT